MTLVLGNDEERRQSSLDSILTSIKKLLGIDEYCDHFDQDVIMHINSALMILNQLGVGPADGFYITGNSETWTDYLKQNKKLELVKTYIYQKVKLAFDPPQSSSAMEAMNRMISEFEWRLNVAVDPVITPEGEEEKPSEQPDDPLWNPGDEVGSSENPGTTRKG